MFERKTYKEIAKRQLKGRWTTPVLATLLATVILGLLNIPSLFESFSNLVNSLNNGGVDYDAVTSDSGFSYFFSYSNSTPVSGRGGLISSLVSLFISGVLLIAQINLYLILSHTTEVQPFGTFIRGFASWLDGFLGVLWYSLWVFLWSLLFVIPGIVKAYSYSQMFFILAEHPGVGVTKAMRLSKAITKGYKGDLFVMTLSFIGWGILSCLTFGILGLWVRPYQFMSFTNAYHALKARAIEAKVVTMEDFTGVSGDVNNGN